MNESRWAPGARARYDGRPVEVVTDFGNGITRVRRLDVPLPLRTRRSGESAAEYHARITSHGICDVATHRLTCDPDARDRTR